MSGLEFGVRIRVGMYCTYCSVRDACLHLMEQEELVI